MESDGIVAPYISVDHQEWFTAQQGQGMMDASTGLQGLFPLDRVADVDAVSATVLQRLA